jgi:hypothetical protein
MKKQKITAVFSNGFTDAYNGVRPVTAAWMITKKETGEVYKSGHSLDRTTAAKTAAGNLRFVTMTFSTLKTTQSSAPVTS